MWFTSYLQIVKSISSNFFYTDQRFLLHYLFLFLYACSYKEKNTCTSKQKQKKCTFLLISDNDNNILLDRYSRQSSTTSEDCSCWAILKHTTITTTSAVFWLSCEIQKERKQVLRIRLHYNLRVCVCVCVCMCVHRHLHKCTLSCAQLLVTPWIVASQAPLSMEFSRKDY